MRNAFVTSLLVLLSLLVPARSKAQSKELISHVYNSVALLYTQTVSGDMKMTCTATAFAVKPADKDGKTTYSFVSAAHCVEGDNDKIQKLQKFYISADADGEKKYLTARLVEAGDKTMGDDFSLFEVVTSDNFVITPLGDEMLLQRGDRVIDVSGALGFGKQYYEGYVSELHVDRPPLDVGEVLWTNLELMQIGGAPGSSGSAIVSVDQKAIIGFLVGDVHSDIGKLCIPVSKFKSFLALVDSGKYKKSAPAPKVVLPDDGN